jgi:hypothetical protein
MRSALPSEPDPPGGSFALLDADRARATIGGRTKDPESIFSWPLRLGSSAGERCSAHLNAIYGLLHFRGVSRSWPDEQDLTGVGPVFDDAAARFCKRIGLTLRLFIFHPRWEQFLEDFIWDMCGFPRREIGQRGLEFVKGHARHPNCNSGPIQRDPCAWLPAPERLMSAMRL